MATSFAPRADQGFSRRSAPRIEWCTYCLPNFSWKPHENEEKRERTSKTLLSRSVVVHVSGTRFSMENIASPTPHPTISHLPPLPARKKGLTLNNTVSRSVSKPCGLSNKTGSWPGGDSTSRGVCIQGVYIQGRSESRGVYIQEVCIQGVCIRGDLHPELGGWTPTPRYMGYYGIHSGQYASYWNTFLFPTENNFFSAKLLLAKHLNHS